MKGFESLALPCTTAVLRHAKGLLGAALKGQPTLAPVIAFCPGCRIDVFDNPATHVMGVRLHKGPPPEAIAEITCDCGHQSELPAALFARAHWSPQEWDLIVSLDPRPDWWALGSNLQRARPTTPGQTSPPLIECPQCATTHPPTARSCIMCGHDLTLAPVLTRPQPQGPTTPTGPPLVACPCGRTLPPGTTACHSCGRSLLARPAPPSPQGHVLCPCGRISHAGTPRCPICDLDLSRAIPVPTSPKPHWLCPRCSASNPATTVTCGMCAHQLPSHHAFRYTTQAWMQSPVLKVCPRCGQPHHGVLACPTTFT